MHFSIDFCAHRLVLQRCSTPVRPIKTVVLWTYDDFLRIAFGMCFASEKQRFCVPMVFEMILKGFGRFWEDSQDILGLLFSPFFKKK